jgi:hypothetical protein
MAVAVVAVIATLLLPHTLVARLRWEVPLVEGLLLAAVIIADPGSTKPYPGDDGIRYGPRESGGGEILGQEWCPQRNSNPCSTLTRRDGR